MRVIAKLVVKGHLVTAGNLIGGKKRADPPQARVLFSLVILLLVSVILQVIL